MRYPTGRESMRRLAVLFACAGLAGTCHADAVMEINELAARVAAPPGSTAAVNTLAVVNLAMFDASNAVERRFAAYRAPTSAPPAGANAEAVALAAGCAALLAMHPAQKSTVEPACAAMATKVTLAEDARKFGEAVAADLVASRRGDGLNAANRYRPFTTAGTYVPTPLPIGWDAATMRPLAMTSPAQFRPGPPPSFASETWVRDYNETKAVGARASATRTAGQTAT